jgi:hypothetical protein
MGLIMVTNMSDVEHLEGTCTLYPLPWSKGT